MSQTVYLSISKYIIILLISPRLSYNESFLDLTRIYVIFAYPHKHFELWLYQPVVKDEKDAFCLRE